MAAGSAAVGALPGPVLELAVEPAGDVFELAHIPVVGDVIFRSANAIWVLPANGRRYKLSSEWRVIGPEGIKPWPASSGSQLGIDRTENKPR